MTPNLAIARSERNPRLRSGKVLARRHEPDAAFSLARRLRIATYRAGSRRPERPLRDSFELDRVVAAEDLHFAAVLRAQRSQAVLVPEPRATVLFHQTLIEPQPWRAARPRIHLCVPEIGVRRLQHPAAITSHRDAGVTHRVADQRDEQDVFGEALQPSHAVEAEPRLAFTGPVRAPVGPRTPLLRTAPPAGEHRSPPLRRLLLGEEHVHGGARKVVEAARMIEVEVRQHDVAYVARVEAEPLDLADRRHLLAEFRSEEREEELAQAFARARAVAQPEAGIDEHQFVCRFDEQAVAGEPGANPESAAVEEGAARGTSRDGVDVMDAHARKCGGGVARLPPGAVAPVDGI